MKFTFTFLCALAFLALPVDELDAQWLPEARQSHERRVWAASGVPFPDGLQFYELPKISQRLVGIVGYVPEDRYGIFSASWKGQDGRAENVNAMYPWAVPSGLHNSPTDQWRKVGGVVFAGPTRVYRKIVQVQNSIRKPGGGFYEQPQPQLHWTFADGTRFFELLVRTHQGREWPFEIREYTVKDNKMTDAVTYRPDLPLVLDRELQVPPGKLSDFGFDAATVKVYKIDRERLTGAPVKLVPRREALTAVRDDELVPRGYLGNVRTCVDCHARAGVPVSYGATTIRGSGGNLSWHPFTAETVNTDKMPVLDRRWNLLVEDKQ